MDQSIHWVKNKTEDTLINKDKRGFSNKCGPINSSKRGMCLDVKCLSEISKTQTDNQVVRRLQQNYILNELTTD